MNWIIPIKFLDIGCITVYYFLFGVLFAKGFDAAFGKFEEAEWKKEPLWKLGAEIVLHLFALGIVAYILRNIVGAIPFLLDGVAGFQHTRIKELGGEVFMEVILVLYQENLQAKLAYFAKEVLGVRVETE